MVPSEQTIRNTKRSVDDAIPHTGGLLDITTVNTINELIKPSEMSEIERAVMEDFVNHTMGLSLDEIVNHYDMLKLFSDHCELSWISIDGTVISEIIPYNGSKYVYLIETYDSNGYMATIKTSPGNPPISPESFITKIAINRQNTFNYFACQNIKTDSGKYGDDIYYWDKIYEILKMSPIEMYDFLMTLIMGEVQYYEKGKLIVTHWSFGNYIRRSIGDFLDPKRFKELVDSGDPLNYEFDE